MDRKEEAVKKYKSGYSCAQAVACTYAKELGMNEEQAYRLSEGFGGGLGHYGHTCGACSAMVMVASYQLCPNMKMIGESKQITYPIIKQMVQQFKEDNGDINCFDILRNAPKGLEDGKRISCIHCVRSVCDQLEKLINEIHCETMKEEVI